MRNEILLGDCLDLVKELPDDSVDLICTDPPYCVGVTSNGRKGNFTDLNLIKPFMRELFGEWQRVLKPGKHCYVFTDWRSYPFLYPILQNYLTVRNLICWDYEWIKAGNWYRFSYEMIIFATKGESKRTFPASEPDVWRMPPINYTKPKNHPAEKTVQICERIIKNSSDAGDVVLDCFLGSGTTAVAAVKSGRNFIGYELDENFFNVAQKRVAAALNESVEPKLNF